MLAQSKYRQWSAGFICSRSTGDVVHRGQTRGYGGNFSQPSKEIHRERVARGAAVKALPLPLGA